MLYSIEEYKVALKVFINPEDKSTEHIQIKEKKTFLCN